jgi:amidase
MGPVSGHPDTVIANPAQVEAEFAAATVTSLAADMDAQRTDAVALVGAASRRIAAIDAAGPRLASVLALSPGAVAEARARDAERVARRLRGPLHGIPLLIKDNIETRDLATTVGSLALRDNRTGRDAPLVTRLRAAGAVILGTTNLSEWANFRSRHSISGWSGLGGLTRNPHVLDRNACGSSTGSAAAVAAGLAPAAIGTETSGSIVCPAAVNGIVGFKPTLGLVARTGIIPIAASFDTAGPMTRTVEDAAIVLDAMAGSERSDPATIRADTMRVPYAARLSTAGLRGRRLGVFRAGSDAHPPTRAVFERALADLRAAGAELIEIDALPEPFTANAGGFIAVALPEFRAGLEAYLATAAPEMATRTLADLVTFNRSEPRALALFGQDIFEQALEAPGLDSPAYLDARERTRRLAGPEGIDLLLRTHRLDALISVTAPPAWPNDPAGASDALSMWGLTAIAAQAGYPHLTVPVGLADGLPVGLSFVGTGWADAEVLALGHAFERLAPRRAAPAFLRSLDDRPATAAALAPQR